MNNFVFVEQYTELAQVLNHLIKIREELFNNQLGTNEEISDVSNEISRVLAIMAESRQSLPFKTV